MRSRLPTFPVALIANLIFLTGCGSKAPQPETVKLTDDLGRTVSVRVPVERIVTMAPNLTEITFAAGAGSQLVGVTTADDYPPEVDSLPKFSALGVDFEAVVALKPDVVLATDQVNTPRDADMFDSLDIAVLYLSFSSLEDIFDGMRTVGRLAGTADRAADHAATLADAILDLRERTSMAGERPEVLFLISGERLFGFGSGSYVHTMIDAAGGTSVSADVDVSAPVFSEEYVIEKAPDVIIGAFPEGTTAADLLAQHPAWSSVPAIRENRVYSIDPDIVLRPGPRVVEGAYRMALLLHPSLFENDASIVRR
jgi:ABC-type Fe3+-hydroxamate transport system substrate-binding protein